MEKTGEGLENSSNNNPKSILEVRPNIPGKSVETPGDLGNSSSQLPEPEVSNASALGLGESEEEGKGGESPSAGPNAQIPVSEQTKLQEPEDSTDDLPFPNPDDSDYPKINSKKGIIPMILGFLEFLLRIFGFKKDKFPKI